MIVKILDAYVNNPGDLSWEPFGELGDLTLYERTSAEELAMRTTDVEIAITNKIMWDKHALDAAPHLKMIALTSTGFNTVDLE
ncbi:MAG: D-2-hydroxyacid dehydrogenase, partial [Raoultibacter sp.]